MRIAVALLGWLLAVALGGLAAVLRRRLELVARADHELRGPLTAIGLLAAPIGRGDGELELGAAIEAQLERARAGLADLHAARSGRRGPIRRERLSLERELRAAAAGWEPLARGSGRSLKLDWRAGEARVTADRGRLGQALGNLISNAFEHGGGRVEVRGRRVGDVVRVEVADGRRGGSATASPTSRRQVPVRRLSRQHGRGLTIAARAARDVGGALELSHNGRGTLAAIELPAEDG